MNARWPILTEEKFSPGPSKSPIMRSSGDMPAPATIRAFSSLSKARRVFLRPAEDERDFKQDEVVRILHSDKRRRVQEAAAGKLMDDLEEVVGES